MLYYATILAQTTTQPAAPKGSPAPMWIGLILMIAVFYFVMFRGQRKDQKHKKQMLADLQKNDRVMTIGGVIGTVTQVKDQEVTIKVDESTNTKITVIRTAIQKVLLDTEDAASGS